MKNFVKLLGIQKHWVCIVVLIMVSAGAVFAQENEASSGTGFSINWSQRSEQVQIGDILISGGLAIGNASGKYSDGWLSVSASTSLFGISIAVDYALPHPAFANRALTIGGETGYLGGDFDLSVIPIMGRLGYHPNVGVDNLNAYGLVKAGLVRGSSYGDSALGFGIGFGVGGRYYFNENLAAFAELGFDRYSYSDSGLRIAAHKFSTLGVTYRHRQ